MITSLTRATPVIVQGITGGQGRFYALRNRAYGTKIVGGVSPKKAGELLVTKTGEDEWNYSPLWRFR